MSRTHIKLWFALVFTLGLFGCASTPEPKQQPLPEQQANADERVEPQEQARDLPHIPVTARELPELEEEPELAAVKYLLDQAQTALDDEEPDRAIALADRALQIDRKSPRTYLILAQVEDLNGRPQLARQLARQGLLYTAENTEIGRQLLKLAGRR